MQTVFFSVVREAIESLEKLGFKVLVVTADGATPNRIFFRMRMQSQGELCYKTENPYADEKRYVYFMSDVPHLLKTTRKCWSQSFAHGHKRKLWVSTILNLKKLSSRLYLFSQNNDLHISWQHLVKLYLAKLSMGKHSQGLTC